MSGWTGVSGASESGTGGAVIAGGDCDGGCGPGGGVNGSSGMSPGMLLLGVDMCSSGSKPGGGAGGAPTVSVKTGG